MYPKKIKPIINTTPITVGRERVDDLMQATNIRSKYFPKPIDLEDLDQSIFDFFNTGKCKIFIDGKIVPTFYLENHRYGEFSKTWKFVDNDKNVLTPYITIRRSGKEKGTRLGETSNVAQQHKFMYHRIPYFDVNQLIYLIFEAPQPTNIDLLYEVSLFTKYRPDVNLFDNNIMRIFSSIQEYVFVNGSPMPIYLDEVNEANTIENIDNDQLYVATYTIKLKGFILNEDDYQFKKTLRKTRLSISTTSFSETISPSQRKDIGESDSQIFNRIPVNTSIKSLKQYKQKYLSLVTIPANTIFGINLDKRVAVDTEVIVFYNGFNVNYDLGIDRSIIYLSLNADFDVNDEINIYYFYL
jgi:hypothetical protein